MLAIPVGIVFSRFDEEHGAELSFPRPGGARGIRTSSPGPALVLERAVAPRKLRNARTRFSENESSACSQRSIRKITRFQKPSCLNFWSSVKRISPRFMRLARPWLWRTPSRAQEPELLLRNLRHPTAATSCTPSWRSRTVIIFWCVTGSFSSAASTCGKTYQK